MKYVGIILRCNSKYSLNKELIDVINKYNVTPVGIIVDFNNNYKTEFKKVKKLIDMCDYFILQGGSDYYQIDIEIARYLYEINKPTLGICLGMQTMAMAFLGIMSNIENHLSNKLYVHNIKINKNSKLYNIIKKDNICVNSRHKSYIVSTNLSISSESNVIESIEDKNKTFYIGVQWHPESIYDENNKKIFDELFKN